MYVLYACIVCMYCMYACIVCMYCMHVLYVCMYCMYVCIVCMYCMYCSGLAKKREVATTEDVSHVRSYGTRRSKAGGARASSFVTDNRLYRSDINTSGLSLLEVTQESIRQANERARNNLRARGGVITEDTETVTTSLANNENNALLQKNNNATGRYFDYSCRVKHNVEHKAPSLPYQTTQ